MQTSLGFSWNAPFIKFHKEEKSTLEEMGISSLLKDQLIPFALALVLLSIIFFV